MNIPVYDVLIIGGGPAGLTAGLYASRARLKTLLLEKMGSGGQAVITDFIENYPGFPDGISGFELAAKFEEQSRKFGLEIKIEEVQSVQSEGAGNIRVETSEGVYRSSAVILATGATFKKLNVPGEDEFRGKGVSYCATCDGPFFRNKKLVVVGGGDSAIQEALFLTRFATSVTVVHRRGTLRATKILQERLLENPKISVLWNSTVTKIEGKETVESITVCDVTTGMETAMPVDGVFIFVGWTPTTSFLGNMIAKDSAGYLITDDSMKTSVEGIYCCGDVRKKLLRQVVTAAGEGAVAAFAAQEYIDEIKGVTYR